jgi:hypothetical protein
VGDQSALGQAEQFLLALITRIPEYRLRLEAMLFQVDLAHVKTNGTGLESWINGAKGRNNNINKQKVMQPTKSNYQLEFM